MDISIYLQCFLKVIRYVMWTYLALTVNRTLPLSLSVNCIKLGCHKILTIAQSHHKYGQKHFNLVNHSLMIGKQVIYSCRMKKIKSDFNIFLSHVKKIQSMELSIA